MTRILPRSARIAAGLGLVLLAGQPVAVAQMGGRVVARLDSTSQVAPASPRVETPPPVPSTTSPTLYLPEGGFVSGEFVDSDGPEAIRWRSPAFAGPIEFATGRVDSIRWPAPAKVTPVQGDYRFEMAGGGVLSGSLVALDDSTTELDVPGVGVLHVDRSSLHRLHRRTEGTDLIYSGPNGLAGWKQAGPKDAWREESGQPFADQPGAMIQSDLVLPARMAVEFELSWKGKPDFLLAIGGGPGDAGLKRAFRFEVFDGELVADREVDAVADLASLGPLSDKGGRLHLLAYIDQALGKLLVVAPDGRTLADLTVPDIGLKPVNPPPDGANGGISRPGDRVPRGPNGGILGSLPPNVQGGLSLVNVKGDVRLENLQVGKWDGQAPRQVEPGRSRVHLIDGSITYAQVVRLDPQAREFVLKVDGGEESRVAVDRIADVFLSAPLVGGPRPVLANQADGGRIGGALLKVAGGAIEMAVPGVREPFRIPFDRLRTLSFQVEPQGTEKGGRQGTLEADGIKLPGSLAESPAKVEGGALAWRPDGGSPASIRPGVAGRIVYVEPRPVVAPSPPMAPQPQVPRALIAINNLLGGLSATSSRVKVDSRKALHLRTGDVIPCDVVSIEEAGVRIKSEIVPDAVVPHDKIKAVELTGLDRDSIKVGKEKRERILTLPRMQKGSPPTQLIRSTNGDYLRGRVVAMDDLNLQVEIRLDTKSVPRDRIARIIWFHADETGPPREAPATPDPKLAPAADAGPVRVQAVRADGVRLTFHPESLAENILSGRSDVIGACQVRLDDVDQLLIGPAIERSASQLAYGRWILRDAEEPKFAKADAAGGAGGSPGTESAMVGKPAPEFSLALLDGKKFTLAENRGQVVILDFWATWCGPCIQAMPQVERVAKEFADRGVKLVAVNLQESPRDIKAMLERHKLDVSVALDVDGVVADKYAATAIPQTVIIDKAGGVARLFVGGGNDFEARLREALTATLEGAEKK